MADSIHSGNLPCVIEDNPYHLALLYPLIQLISFSALIWLSYMLGINKPHGNIALRSVFIHDYTPISIESLYIHNLSILNIYCKDTENYP